MVTAKAKINLATSDWQFFQMKEAKKYKIKPVAALIFKPAAS
jgi:hypothetical protein